MLLAAGMSELRRPVVVVVDGGHGNGAQYGGSSSQPLENELTHDLARRVGSALSGFASVILTRDRDSNPSLAARAHAAQRAQADAFVSLHFNRAADRSTQGTEAWVHHRASPASDVLGRRLQAAVAGVTGNAPQPVQRANLAVLTPDWHAPKTAACLLEVSYVTDPREQARLGEGAYRDRIADAVAGAIRAQLGGAAQPLARGLAASPTAWTPVRADEVDTSTNTDKFASQTFDVTVPLLTNAGRVPTTVSVFLPRYTRSANFIRVHVFWSPGNATDTGLTRTPPARANVGFNAVNFHGLRGSTDASEWMMIGVPGILNGFVSMDEAAIVACLSAVNDDTPYTAGDIGALRLSCHSRGAAGLGQSLERDLLPGSKVERVVIFDAVGSGPVNSGLTRAAIPGSKQFAYQVNDPTLLSATGATNIKLDGSAMRAIGYSRLFADASATAAVLGATVPAYAGTVLPLPARGTFTTRATAAPGMTDIRTFASTNIATINLMMREESTYPGPKTFVDANNLTRLYRREGPFDVGILTHHLFVAELAHEIVD